MEKQKISTKFLFPVLLSFFVMSFCDLVGIGVDEVKKEFSLNYTKTLLIPSAVFLWFLILSIPTSVLQDRFGKRNILNAGIIFTSIGLFIPFIFTKTFTPTLIGFLLIGIGNTIVQVSANPLLLDVVPSSKSSSFLSFSQFIKAIGSMIAPILVIYFSTKFGNWRLIFLVFGVISLISALWLSFVKIEESKNLKEKASFKSSLKLLNNGYIVSMVIGILLVVGIDVGINVISGQFFEIKLNASPETAKSVRSIYFIAKMIGTFFGAILLARVNSQKFFKWSSIIGLISLIALLLAPNSAIGIVLIFIVGLGFANIFPLIFSLTVSKYPSRSNEISGLMIMAVSGGAIPALMGPIIDKTGKVSIALSILIVASIYLLGLSLFQKKEEKEG